MAKDRTTEDLEEYRSLMERPDTFEEGFTYRTVIGAFFVGFIMMPGAIYMGLIAGVTLGSAAEHGADLQRIARLRPTDQPVRLRHAKSASQPVPASSASTAARSSAASAACASRSQRRHLP